MRRILAKVDDGRLGRAVAGLVTRRLVVQEIKRREKSSLYILYTGKNGKWEEADIQWLYSFHYHGCRGSWDGMSYTKPTQRRKE